MAMVDLADYEPLRIEQITEPGLFLPIEEHDEPCLCLPEADGITAVFLAGEWAYHSDSIAKLSNRKGILVRGVAIRADFDSRVIDVGSKIGALIRSEGVNGIRTYRASQGGYTQTIVIPVDGGTSPCQFAPDSARVAFPKWEIGRELDGEWAALWKIDVSA